MNLTASDGPMTRNDVAFIHLQFDVAQDVKELSFRERVIGFEVFELDHRHDD
jgi:hypothetical protein